MPVKSPKRMTFDEFMGRMLGAFPDAVVEEDNEGQMVVYTGLMKDGDDVVPHEVPDETEA